jgi:hypothetical protein
MFDHRRETRSTAPAVPAYGDLHDWVRGLPWVVERPYCVGAPGVRSFEVDCDPLERRHLWLITGLRPSRAAELVDVAVIVPIAAADMIVHAGWATPCTPMPAERVLMVVDPVTARRRNEVEVLVLTAYSCAIG